MATISAFLNKQYQGKDGYQIAIRIYHKGKRKIEGIGYSVPEDYWDEENGRVKGRFKDKDLINARIEDLLLTARNYDSECRRTGQPFLLERVFKKESPKSVNFTEYLRSQQKRYNTDGMIGSARRIKAILGDLTEWMKGDVYFQDFDDREAAKNLNTFLIEKGNSANTRKQKFTILRTQWNRAIDEVGAPGLNPFMTIKIKKEKSRKVWLTEGELEQLSTGKMARSSQEIAKDAFLFSYHCYGMRFDNVISVKKSDIYSGRVNWKAVKGKKYTYKEIHDDLEQIIIKYINTPGEYLFPHLNGLEHLTEEQLFDKKSHLNYLANKSLKGIAERLKLPPITFHSARHTFATHAINRGVPIHVLKDMLTHSSIKQTEDYIAELNVATRDEYGRQFYGSKLKVVA